MDTLELCDTVFAVFCGFNICRTSTLNKWKVRSHNSCKESNEFLSHRLVDSQGQEL